MPRTGILKRIGPAFIVGAVIIGPGSVTLMSQTGARYGYSMLWLSLMAGTLMAGFIALFMRFGIYCDETFLGVVRRRAGRWFAAITGISLFSVGATFQFGNNLGVTAAMDAVFPRIPEIIWPVVFTAVSIVFMFSFKNIYKAVEKLMTVFLVGMFLAFLINLIQAKPHIPSALKGALVPSIPNGADWVTFGGLIATTFTIPAAFFQSYLVKAKGWTPRDLVKAAGDTILASIIYTLIGTVIMMTAAAVVYPQAGDITFENMVAALEGVFGRHAKLVFCLGYWAAAFSSFITNSLIAGMLLSDGLNIGAGLEARSPKICATLALVTGMTVAVAILHVQNTTRQTPQLAAETQAAAATQNAASGDDAAEPHSVAAAVGETRPRKPRDIKVAAIAVGQACTMLAVPFGAIAMVIALFDTRGIKARPLPIWTKAFVLFGALLLLGIAAMMYVKIQPRIASLLGDG